MNDHTIFEFTNPRNSGRRIVATLTKDTSNDTIGALNELKMHVERFLTHAYDVKGNRNFGPIERGERISEGVGPLAKNLKASVAKIAAKRDALREDVLNFNPITPYTTSKPWEYQFDLRLVDAFNALPVSKQALIRHQLRDPETATQHVRLAEAMLRMPEMLSPLDYNDRSAVRVNIGRLFKPDEVASIEKRITEQEVLTKAIRATIQTITDETGSSAAAIDQAREAWNFVQEKSPGWPREEPPSTVTPLAVAAEQPVLKVAAEAEV